MQRQTAQSGQGLAGTERYGAVHDREVRQMLPAHMQPGVELAPPSGVKYGIQSQCTYIRENHEQCGAPQKRGSKYCVGHTRRVQKQEAQEKEKASGNQE